MFDIRKLWALNPLSIAFIYLAFAIIWILASDAILESFVSEPTLLSNLQTLKGLLYVFFTAALLFLLIKKSTTSIEQDRKSLNNSLFAAKMATWDMDVKTKIITRSNNHFKLFGLKAGAPEWTLEDFISKIHPDDRVKVSENFKNALEKGEVYSVEYRVVWPDASIHYMWSRGTLVRNEDGKAERVSGVISDITDRVQLEKDYFHKTDLFENIFENIPVMVNITSSDLTEFRVNKNFVEVLGWGNENMSPQEMLVSCYPNEDYRNQVLTYISNNNPKEWRDFKVTSKSGEVKTQRWTNFKLENGTNIGIGIDVTEAREIERELQNQKEELQESRDRYKKAEEIAKIGHWERNLVTDEVVWSEGFYNLLGLDPKKISSSYDNLLTRIVDEDKEAFINSFDDAIKSGIFDSHFRVKHQKTGEIIFFHSIGEVEYKNGTPFYIRGTLRDITEIKKFERDLQEHTDFIETTLDNLPIGVAVNKIDEGTATLMNKTFSDIYGWPEEEIVDVSTFFEKVYPDPEYRQEIMTMILDDLKSRNPDRMNWNGIKITTKSGEKRVVNAKNIPLYDQNLMISTVLDVTDLYEKTSENERIFEHSSELMCIVDQNGVMKRINKSWTKTLGWTLEELQSKPIIEFFHPDDKDLSYRLINELLTEKKPVSITNRMVSKSGKYHTLSWNSVIDPDGENIFGVARDITLVQEIEKALNFEKRRFELVAKTSSDVIWDLDIPTNNLWWSNGFQKTFGHNPKHYKDKLLSWTSNIHTDDKERVLKTFSEAIESKTKKDWKESFRFIKEDGSIAYVEDHGIILRKENKEAYRMVGTINDNTEIVEAEKELKESEKKYRLLFEQSPLPMWIYNPENLKFIEVNKAAIKHYGYSAEEFANMTLFDIRPPEEREKLLKYFEKDRDLFHLPESWQHQKKNGEKILVEISSSPIDYFGSQFFLILATDVTQQRTAEKRVISSLIEGENRERKRIAQELHDGLGQYLAAANMNFDAVKDASSSLPEKKQKQFINGLNHLKHAISETRSISHNLMPRAVEDYGLPLAVEAMIDAYKKSTSISFTYYQNIEGVPLSDEISINLFRIIQESLSNAIKYSKATKINIQLIKDKLDLLLTIEDNGVGFDKNNKKLDMGLGLKTIRTRTNALGGNFELETEPNKGTLIHVIVPISSIT